MTNNQSIPAGTQTNVLRKWHSLAAAFRIALYSTAVLVAAVLFLYSSVRGSEEIIDISVKGISDNHKDGAQKDRMEAILDAKRQACEKAGITISAKTTVENFKLVYDYVESQAKAVLLPGFQVIDVGYMEDGTYAVVLIGKIKKSDAPTGDRAQFTFLIWLTDNGKDFPDKAAAVDKLYQWFTSFKCESKFGEVPLDKMETELTAVARNDSLYYGGRRFYAFTYTCPPADYVYTQRTPMTNGKTEVADFKIRLRPGKRYIMDIAHSNAVYFDEPQAYEGTFKHPREKLAFPDDFKPLFTTDKK
ncbi:MAG TPA: hypothetical protein VLX68_15510 [Chitinivibrionales bacterium]|nr:hypothetical protein [Chitinivibrionales bacterium]